MRILHVHGLALMKTSGACGFLTRGSAPNLGVGTTTRNPVKYAPLVNFRSQGMVQIHDTALCVLQVFFNVHLEQSHVKVALWEDSSTNLGKLLAKSAAKDFMLKTNRAFHVQLAQNLEQLQVREQSIRVNVFVHADIFPVTEIAFDAQLVPPQSTSVKFQVCHVFAHLAALC